MNHVVQGEPSMHQTILRRVRGPACAAALLFALAGCRGDADTADAVARFTPLPDSAAASASDSLVDGDLQDAIKATREVAARGGVPIPTETILLGYAFDARRKATQMRLDSNEFAQMLLSLGFPFDGLRQGAAAGSRQSMLRTIEPDEREDAHKAEGEIRVAERDAAQGARDAASERHQARKAAVLASARQRHDAAAEKAHALTKAPREEYEAGWDDARRERDAAYKALQDAKAEARALDAAYMQELEALSAARKAEDAAARQVGPNARAGRQLMELLAAWVRAAAADPDHPDSFVPLYLAEMARRQADPIDLAEAPPAHQHRWSLLEMALFAAAFQPRDEGAPASGAMAASTLLDVLVPPAHAASPTACEIAEDAWGSWKDVAATANGEITNALLERELSTRYGEMAAKEIGRTLSTMSIIGKIAQLAAFYAHTQVTVESDIDFLHKPQAGHRKVTYTARAGVSPEELEAFEEARKKGFDDQAIRDCLGWANLPNMDSIRDVAKDAEDWYLDWRLFGNGKHATWGRRDNPDARFFGGGRVGMPMKRVSGSSTESRFVVRIQPEAGHTGPQNTAQVEVRAEVDSAGLPSLSTLISAGKGALGLAEAIVDVGAGWIREVFKPKAYAVVTVEFHCPDPTYIFRDIEDPVADGGGDGSEGCTFHFDTRQDYQEWRAGWE